MLQVMENYPGTVHICSLSSASAINKIRRFRKTHSFLTCGTTPHYMYFTSEDIKNGATVFKESPPIRNPSNNELLWDLLRMKAIDCISSNHASIPPLYKMIQGSFRRSLNGINCQGFSFQSIWTKLSQKTTDEELKEHYIVRLSKWFSLNPAKILGIEHQRGSIEKGKFADFIVWRPDQRQVASSHSEYSEMNVYEETSLLGRITKVCLRGNWTYNEGEFFESGQFYSKQANAQQ